MRSTHTPLGGTRPNAQKGWVGGRTELLTVRRVEPNEPRVLVFIPSGDWEEKPDDITTYL